ncbi:hypothetical protein IFM89_037763 [Coptis chinensis]|uniref:Uncharacterized protein n=1 Tax=Coptis chinensis TaxID=261450 RepID=A0A835MB69_9MAGN|nr:hypothetical protein IFM89_037763 [Coptis chinensis]
MVIGDFNIVTKLSERRGGRFPCKIVMNEFVEFINANALLDLTTVGMRFSWTSRRSGDKRMIQKIDRVLVNQNWLNSSGVWKSRINKRKFSGHSPVVGSLGV